MRINFVFVKTTITVLGSSHFNLISGRCVGNCSEVMKNFELIVLVLVLLILIGLNINKFSTSIL